MSDKIGGIGFDDGLEVSWLKITSGNVLSESLATNGKLIYGIIHPAITGTSLKFQGSNDDTNYYAIRDHLGADFTLTVGSSAGRIPIMARQLDDCSQIQVISSTAEAADRLIGVVLGV